MLTKLRQIAAKIEVTEGTAETLAAADAGLLVSEPTFEAVIPKTERNVATHQLGRFRKVVGAQIARMTFKAELKGSGTAGTAPALGKYLKACGMSETVVAVTSVTYAPLTQAVPSLTIAGYFDGVFKSLVGARGKYRLIGRIGEHIIVEMEWMGRYVAVTDVAMLSGVTYDTTTEPQPLLSAAFSAHGFAGKLNSIDIDYNNTLTAREDASLASGIISHTITDREMTGSFNVEEELVATEDYWGKNLSGVEGALTYTLTGAAGNIVTVAGTDLQYQQAAENDREGVSGLQMDFALDRNTGDDGFSIAFT